MEMFPRLVTALIKIWPSGRLTAALKNEAFIPEFMK
jgi:hypothetical protein